MPRCRGTRTGQRWLGDSWAVSNSSRPDQQRHLRGTGHISALETARENIVPQPLNLASEAPWACPSEFLIHWSCQMLVCTSPRKKMRTLLFLWVGGIELSFESNESPLWRTGSFLFASTVAGLELVTNVFWEMSKGEAVKASLAAHSCFAPC